MATELEALEAKVKMLKEQLPKSLEVLSNAGGLHRFTLKKALKITRKVLVGIKNNETLRDHPHRLRVDRVQSEVDVMINQIDVALR